MTNALGELVGSFDAAFSEGLLAALAETKDENLKDLVERRLLAGYYKAVGPELQEAEPLDVVLYCPACGLQHIDAAEPHVEGSVELTTWRNPPHRSHLCHQCGHIWRPADVPTNGVLAVKTKGKSDSPTVPPKQPDWVQLKEYGYAPGDYMCKCRTCGQTVSGLDKRAITCAPCAETLHTEAKTRPERVTKEMWQALCESQAVLLDIHARTKQLQLRLGLAELAAPIDPTVAAELERSDWTPEEALRWYAAGRHYDTVPNGDGTSSARILDNGAVASNALKSLSREYAEHKGDVALEANALPSEAVMRPMEFEDGRKGWYVQTPYFYCDIEPDETGMWGVFFRAADGKEAFGEMAQPAEPTNDVSLNARPAPEVSLELPRGSNHEVLIHFYKWTPAENKLHICVSVRNLPSPEG